MSFQVAYIPIGVGTFHLESAQNEFEKSIQLLKSLTEDGVYPDKMLLTLDDLNEFLDGIHPDLIVLQNITFANAAYACEVLKRPAGALRDGETQSRMVFRISVDRHMALI